IKKDWNGNTDRDRVLLSKKAVPLVRRVQGQASGADVAASIFGGVLFYQKRLVIIDKLANSLPLTVVYSGKKIATLEVLKQVDERAKQMSETFKDLYVTMAACSAEACIAAEERDRKTLGELINVYHGLLDALGVSNAILSELVYALRSDKNVYGAKISGAGMGDCVIALGESSITFPQNKAQEEMGVRTVATKVDSKGLIFS
ncbi:MAG: hypothetical protein WCW01_05635, partial [Gammaproteobacteria bacterium]